MIYRTTLFILIFTLAGLAQEPPKAILVDEFDPRDGCETLLSRLDALLVDVSNDVGSKAFVVIQQGSNAFDNLVVYTMAKNHARFHKFPAEQYSVILTQGGPDIKVELWMGRGGATPPFAAAELALTLPEPTSRSKLSEDTVELVTIDGRETFIPTGNPSCLYWFNPRPIHELLKANDGFEAELVIKAASRSRYRKLVRILTSEFREMRMPIERIRYTYGGSDKEIEGSGVKLASIATYFVQRPRK
ncbi:MAG: hypothetical protein IPM21_01130 [Acidobacteria bacterium]|nr:hypothetical protein [Acidobacteriota bacterium]